MISLPIDKYYPEIMASIKDYPVTLIVGETGSGKSTRVPRMCIEDGHSCIITQPRRLAAINVAKRVADELNGDLGGVVGYSTRYEKEYSKYTTCLFCTDGLGLVREMLTEHKFDILILDEVHEFNLSIEALLAWIKYQLDHGEMNRRYVLMSASVDVIKFKEYFGEYLHILEVEGRTFPVIDHSEKYSRVICDEHDVFKVVVNLIHEEKDILMFLPGKKEISDYKRRFNDAGLNAEVLVLHGDMTYKEQCLAFGEYGRPRLILSTNVAQTSITPDVDVVLDSELEKCILIRDGVEGLYLQRISKADVQQRMGRAGRTKVGEYISFIQVANLDVESLVQNDYATPEIERLYLDHVYLKLCAAGLDPLQLDFFHNPNIRQLAMAKKGLYQLGCITFDSEITELGKILVKYPLDARYAKILYLASEYGVFEPCLQIICCLMSNVRYKYPRRDVSSDLEAYGTYLQYTNNKSNDELKRAELNLKAHYGMIEMYKRMFKDKNIEINNDNTHDDWNKMHDTIERIFVSCMLDNLWATGNITYGNFYHLDSLNVKQNVCTEADIVGRSVNKNYNNTHNMVCCVGIPIDIQIKTRYGYNTLRLLNFIIPYRDIWMEWFPDKFKLDLEFKESFQYNVVGYPIMKCGNIKLGNTQYSGLDFHIVDKCPTALQYIKFFNMRIAQYLNSFKDEYNVVPSDKSVEQLNILILGMLKTYARWNNFEMWDPWTNLRIYRGKQPNQYGEVNHFAEYKEFTDARDDIPEVKVDYKQYIPVPKMIPKKEVQLWHSVSAGKVMCPKGHVMKMSKALDHDPTKLYCPICKTEGKITGLGS